MLLDAKTPIPAFNHHVPALIIKRWGNAIGKVWCWNKLSEIEQPVASDPDKIFGERYANVFYDLDGQRNPIVENRFSILESAFNTTLDELIHLSLKQKIKPFSPELVKRLHKLYWNLLVRSPKIRDRHKVGEEYFDEHIAQRISSLQMDGVKLPPIAAMLVKDGKEKGNLKRHIEVLATGAAATQHPVEVEQFGIVVLEVMRDSKSFLLGRNAFNNFSMGSNSNAFFALPVSQKLAIAPFGQKGTLSRIIVDDLQLRKFNQAIWRDNFELVSCSRELMLSLSGNG